MVEWIQSIDIWLLLFIQEYMRFDALDGFWKTVTFLGNAGWFWVALALILAFSRKREARAAGLAAIIAMAVCFLVTNVFLKNAVARIRPYDAYEAVLPLIAGVRDFSFPSGHTCISFACAIIYCGMLPGRFGNFAVVLAVLIAFSRLYLGVHYPTDVLGGILVAAAVSLSVLAARRKYLEKAS